MAKRIVTPATTTTTTTTTAAVAAPTLAPASNPAAATVVATTTFVVAPVGGIGRKAHPAGTTVAGMLLAALAGGPTCYNLCQQAVAHAPSTGGANGKAHNLRPLLAFMAKWGYGFACQAGTLTLTHYPSNLACPVPGAQPFAM